MGVHLMSDSDGSVNLDQALRDAEDEEDHDQADLQLDLVIVKQDSHGLDEFLHKIMEFSEYADHNDAGADAGGYSKYYPHESADHLA